MIFKFQSLFELDKCQFIINTNQSPLISPFAFDLLLQQSIKDKQSILIVLLAQNLQHYSAVSMKCGINLKNYIDNGLVKVIDTFDYDIVIDPDRFVEDIQTKLSIMPEKSFILIDDIQVFNSLGISARKTFLIIKQIQSMLYRKQGKIFIGMSMISNDRSKWNQLVNNLIFECDYWLDCDCPKTGYSQHINGIVRCFNRHDQSTMELNYRISNRNIIFTKL
ncbi:hypothetical protein HUG17_10219 [Dermatophagoides farinae]|uniref:Elongator complex protein 6 n=1 Tax=Dermatophagoides farinae TaxID=6954 RepID=A0A9D4SB82_DERFA|nr:uncharacterized protein LOC124498170 [Dermatophagoides farinae]KAH7636249.1 hypothetical protein HUG17_10219 [Dermatophagoides farinae]